MDKILVLLISLVTILGVHALGFWFAMYIYPELLIMDLVILWALTGVVPLVLLKVIISAIEAVTS